MADKEQIIAQITAAFAAVEYPGDWRLRGSDCLYLGGCVAPERKSPMGLAPCIRGSHHCVQGVAGAGARCDHRTDSLLTHDPHERRVDVGR
jgi:hypothetical protein